MTGLKASEGELKKYRDHLEELVEKRTFKLKMEMAEREKANEALRVTKERLEYVLGATKTGFDIVDGEYNVVYVDPAWESTLGDYRGRKCYDYFMGGKKPCETCAIPTALKTRKSTISEEYLKKEGRYIEVHTIPFKADDGKWLVAEFNLDVTERKKADMTLKESEQKYRRLVETTGTGYVVLGVTGCVTDANTEYIRLTGHSKLSDILGRSVTEWTAPHDLERNAEAVRKCFERGSTYGLEIDYVWKDGSIHPIEINATVADGASGKSIITLCRDITSRRAEQNALRDSETKFRELADNSPNMIFINHMGKVVYANKKCSEIMGYAPEEFLADGFDFISLVAPEDRKRVRENAQKRLDGVESAPYEYTLLTKDHRRFEVLINSKPIRYEGQPAILGIITDVSQLKRVKVDLAEMEDFQRNILRMMPEAVIVSDLTGKITFASEKALELGHVKSMKDVEGMSFFELIDPEDHERAFDDMAKLLKSESHTVTRYRCVRKDGTTYDGEVSSALLKSATGKVRAIMGIVRDVTERNKIESALLESEEKYRHLVEMANVGIAIIQNGKVAFFNEKALHMMGYTKEMAGRFDFLEAIADDQRGRVAELYAKRMRGEEVPSMYETVLKRSDGSKFPAEITASIITYLGKPADMVIIRDISEIAKAGPASQHQRKPGGRDGVPD